MQNGAACPGKRVAHLVIAGNADKRLRTREEIGCRRDAARSYHHNNRHYNNDRFDGGAARNFGRRCRVMQVMRVLGMVSMLLVRWMLFRRSLLLWRVIG